LRSFRELNDAFGFDGTDAINQLFGEVLHALGAGRFDLAHPHGDEYLAHGDNREEMERLFRYAAEVVNAIVFVGTRENGSLAVQPGLTFAFGVAEDEDTADREELPKAKEAQG